MKNKPIDIFLLTAALLVFFLQACNSGDDKPPSPLTNSTANNQNRDTLKDFLAEYIFQTNFGKPDTNNLINKTLALMAAFDSVSVNFKRDSFELIENAPESGELVAIHSPSTQLKRIDGEVFGEIGKLEFSFYMINKDSPQLSSVIFKHTEHDKPMYEKDMKVGPPIITYEIYCDNRLVAVLDKQRKKKAIAENLMDEKVRDTKQAVLDYLRTVHILK